MTSAPHSTKWPKPFLLELYNKAIDEGCCKITVTSPAEARSIIAAFHRLRRRSDSAIQASYIRPEMELVGAQYDEPASCIYFIFNAMPDGSAVPKIESVSSGERSAIPPQNSQLSRATPLPDEELDLDQLMEQLEQEAKQKQIGDGL